MLTTLDYQSRLIGKNVGEDLWNPISASEIAKEATEIRRSAFFAKSREEFLSQQFFHYTSLQQLQILSQFFPKVSFLGPNKEEWIKVFSESPPGFFDSWWTWIQSDLALLSCLNHLNLFLFQSPLLKKALRSMHTPFHKTLDCEAFAHQIAKMVLPLLQKNLDTSYSHFYQSPVARMYAKTSLFALKPRSNLKNAKNKLEWDAPVWISLVCKASNPNYDLQFHNNVRDSIPLQAFENIKMILTYKDNLMCEHFIRLIESISRPESSLTRFDKIQINAYLQTHSPASCQTSDLDETHYELDFILSYLEHHGLFLDLKPEKSTLYSWVYAKGSEMASTDCTKSLIHATNDNCAQNLSSSFVNLIPHAISNGGSLFIQNLPSIAIGIVTLIALLGPQKVEQIRSGLYI